MICCIKKYKLRHLPTATRPLRGRVVDHAVRLRGRRSQIYEFSFDRLSDYVLLNPRSFLESFGLLTI